MQNNLKKIIKEIIYEVISEQSKSKNAVMAEMFLKALNNTKVSSFVDNFLNGACEEYLDNNPYDPYNGWPEYSMEIFTNFNMYDLLEALKDLLEDIPSFEEKFPGLNVWLADTDDLEAGDLAEKTLQSFVKRRIGTIYVLCLDRHKWKLEPED